MKKIILFFTLVFFTINTSISQTIQPKLDWAISCGNTGSGIIVKETKLDLNGNIYSTGHFVGTIDFDPGVDSTYKTASSNNGTAFIQKLDSSGNFIWVKIFTSSTQSLSLGSSIDFDQAGNIYTTGSFQGAADFDPDTGTFELTSTVSNYSMFVVKLDGNGSFKWAQGYDTNPIYRDGLNLIVDHLDNIIVTGIFTDTVDFDQGSSVFNLVAYYLNHDQFILKLNPNGGFIWAKSFTGIGAIYPIDLTVDLNNDIVMVGRITQPFDFDPSLNVFLLSPAIEGRQYVVKLNNNGGLIWAYAMSVFPNEDLYIGNVVTDNSNNIYVSGNYTGTIDFDLDVATFLMTSEPSYSSFIQKLAPNGSFAWAKGDTNGVAGPVSAIDIDGNLYSTYGVDSTLDFDPGTDTLLLSHGAYYIQKLDSNGNFIWAKRGGSHGYIFPHKINLLSPNTFVVTGGFSNGLDIDFDPDSTESLLSAQGVSDIFVLKFEQILAVGTKEVNSNSDFMVYPNPTTGSLIIETEKWINTKIFLYDLTGNIVLKNNLTSNSVALDISHVHSGIYFVTVTSENGIMVKRIVKL